jgi:hypothetical protein
MVLQFGRQAASTARADAMEVNSLSFRHSSRSRPLKLSTKASYASTEGTKLTI